MLHCAKYGTRQDFLLVSITPVDYASTFTNRYEYVGLAVALLGE